jgi:hypothetical protein
LLLTCKALAVLAEKLRAKAANAELRVVNFIFILCETLI